MWTSSNLAVLASAAFLACSAPSVQAWGASGHQAVGYVAMNFLNADALAFVKSSLGSTYNQSLGVAATWADDIKSNSAYNWASNLHFVDAEDNPPSSCSVQQARDCADGRCILTAIANYTTRVVDTSLSAAQRQEALKFIDHFIGDIGQPLHVEADALGGNEISVKCAGSSTNLHSVWDSGIINRLLAANYSSSVQTWANTLTSRIKNGAYTSASASWNSCTTLSGTTCPLVWAKESNAFDCSFVFSYTQFSDLCTTSYYTNAIPIIEQQIAKQGFRLAGWLNLLFK